MEIDLYINNLNTEMNSCLEQLYWSANLIVRVSVYTYALLEI